MRSSPQRTEDFAAAIQRLNDSRAWNRSKSECQRLQILILILDIVTRWNSTYFMMERAWTYREVRVKTMLLCYISMILKI